MPEGRVSHPCLICGKPVYDPLKLYCAECEYELKRVRLADEETVEEWMERMMEEHGTAPRIPEGFNTLCC